MLMQVRMTWSEVLSAVLVGVFRRLQDLKSGCQERYGCNAGDGWQTNIEGAIGEAVVAKLMDKWWSGSLGNWQAADVGNLQVRTTKHKDGRLIVHPKDKDNDVFILVVGEAPTYDVAGWIRGIDAKSEMHWQDPKGGRPAYFVPRDALQPMDVLSTMADLYR